MCARAMLRDKKGQQNGSNFKEDDSALALQQLLHSMRHILNSVYLAYMAGTGMVTVLMPRVGRQGPAIYLWNVTNLSSPAHSLVGHRSVHSPTVHGYFPQLSTYSSEIGLYIPLQYMVTLLSCPLTRRKQVCTLPYSTWLLSSAVHSLVRQGSVHSVLKPKTFVPNMNSLSYIPVFAQSSANKFAVFDFRSLNLQGFSKIRVWHINDSAQCSVAILDVSQLQC